MLEVEASVKSKTIFSIRNNESAFKIVQNHGDLENTGYVNKKRALELKAGKALTKLIRTSDCTKTLHLTLSFQ